MTVRTVGWVERLAKTHHLPAIDGPLFGRTEIQTTPAAVELSAAKSAGEIEKSESEDEDKGCNYFK
jgi:hypothetical protein